MNNKLILLLLALLVIGLSVYFFKSKFINQVKDTSDSTLRINDPMEQKKDEKKNDEIKTDESKEITITSPKANDELSLPFTITGKARVFENQFNYKVVAGDGTILAEGTAMTDSKEPSEFGNYKIEITQLNSSNANSGKIEVFDYSAKDGSVIELVSVPVTFKSLQTVKVFFPKQGAQDCTIVLPVTRSIQSTKEVGKAAITELLKGPSADDKAKGYITLLPEGAALNSLVVTNGTAKADFSQKLQEDVAGSCRVTGIRAQITETLKQFPTVKNVVISVNGEVDTALQP